MPAYFYEDEARNSKVAGANSLIWAATYAAADPPSDGPPSAAAAAARLERCYQLHRRLAQAPAGFFTDGYPYLKRWELPAFHGHVVTGVPGLEAVVGPFLREKRRAQLAERCAALDVRCAEEKLASGACAAFLAGDGGLDAAVAAAVAAAITAVGGAAQKQA